MAALKERQTMIFTTGSLQSLSLIHISLQGYLPEIEGSTKEKLETALNNALLAHPDVQTWTAADVASWMGLDKLNLDTAVQTDIATQILQTALAVPDGTKEKIMQDFKDSVPTAEEIKEAIDWDSMTNEDWAELRCV